MWRILSALRPFRAVIEASASYRWLYDRLTPLGEVILAHPLRLRASIARPAKTDKLDAALLAQSAEDGSDSGGVRAAGGVSGVAGADASAGAAEPIGDGGEESAARAAGGAQHPSAVPKAIRGARASVVAVVGPRRRGQPGAGRVDRPAGALRSASRLGWTRFIQARANDFPQIEALRDIRGIGTYTALLVVAEIGAPERFSEPGQVSSYAGLAARVDQSGAHDYHGHITRQGSPWLRWALVQAAMKAIGRDRKLANFYERVRKRSSRHIARVAVARKLAEICWIRLRRWHRERAAA